MRLLKKTYETISSKMSRRHCYNVLSNLWRSINQTYKNFIFWIEYKNQNIKIWSNVELYSGIS